MRIICAAAASNNAGYFAVSHRIIQSRRQRDGFFVGDIRRLTQGYFPLSLVANGARERCLRDDRREPPTGFCGDDKRLRECYVLRYSFRDGLKKNR